MARTPISFEQLPPPRSLSWVSMMRTARASVGIVVLIALSLLLLPQMRDILVGVSDYSSDRLWPGIAYHLSLFFLAFSAWFWSRTALGARFHVRDEQHEREALAGSLSENGYPIDAAAFDVLPRLLFLGIALGGVIAAAKSSDWLDAGITFGWSIAGYALLHNRLRIKTWLGSPPRSTGTGRGRPVPPRSPEPNPSTVESEHAINEQRTLPA